MGNKSYTQRLEDFQRTHFPKQYKKVESNTVKVLPDYIPPKYIVPFVLPSSSLIIGVILFFASRCIAKKIEFGERMFAFGGHTEPNGSGKPMKKYPKWKLSKKRFLFKQHPSNTTFSKERYEDLINDIKRLKGISLVADEPTGGWHVFRVLEIPEQIDVD